MSEVTYETISKARNLQVLYLVSDDFDPDKLMDLMILNMKLWGGRYNPIIPISKNTISDHWKSFMKNFDPDYIYHSKNVEVKFAIGIVTELELNPIEIIEIEANITRIKGLQSQHLLPLIGISNNFFQASSIWDWNSPLKDYYKFNYLLDDSNVIIKSLIGDHKIIIINKENIGEFDKILHENRVTNYSILSTLNVTPVILRLQNPAFRGFELIIASRENCYNELIYHWNKKSFDIGYQLLTSLFITVEQFDELIKTEWFKQTLFDSAGNENRIDIVSFSLDSTYLETVRQKLQTYTAHNRFVVIEPFDFPFDIMDANGHRHIVSKEKQAIQTNPSSTYFINLPVLSFNRDFDSSGQEYALNIELAQIERSERNQKKFPLNTEAQYFFRGPGRIDKSRRLVAVINNSIHEKSVLDFNVLTFFQNIQQIITSPRKINERSRGIYSDCAFNDGSNKLTQFFKLFQDSFLLIEEFLLDKFWSDLFLELTDNNKVEGDTITFTDIFNKCYTIMLQEGVEFGEHPATRHNKENLQIGLKNTLQELVENKVFLTGYIVKCKHCSSKIWFSLPEINNYVVCKGCSNENHFKVESPISYKLNHLIKNNYGMKSAKGIFMPDGNLTAIRTLISLKNKSRTSFEYLPQIDIYTSHQDRKPKTDLDIISLVDGELYIGECKHSSPLFFESGNKSLNSLIELASTIKPDKLIISCTEDTHEKLDKAKKYLEHNISGWINKPEVIAYKTWPPSYFGTNQYRYFYY